MTIQMVLGLPHLARGPLLRKARELDTPILISANCLSRWKVEGVWQWGGRAAKIRTFESFNTKPLENARGMRVWLDSAGFVAMSRFRGFPWAPEDYIDLAASFPFERFASMDYCVESEVAANLGEVRDRISRTVRLNVQCLNLAARAKIADRFMPVIQGNQPEDYLRCLERMPFAAEFSVIGVGSMCRRHVHGPDGILAVVSAVDQALTGMGSSARLHLFGLKSAGAEAVRAHPRVFSVDSQAYGVAARQNARKAGVSKTNAYVAEVMEDWLGRQRQRLAKPDFAFQGSLLIPTRERVGSLSPFERAVEQAREELRELIENGELEHDQIIERWVYERAGEIISGCDEEDAMECAA